MSPKSAARRLMHDQGGATMSAALLLRYWKYGALAILALLLGVQTLRIGSLKHNVAAEKAVHAQDIATWRAAGVQATANALQQARSIEQQQQKVTQDALANLDTLHARNAELTRLWLAARADHSGTGQAHLPYDLGSSGSAAATAPETVMVEASDLPICNAALETAQGWQDLYRAQHAIDRTPR
jgi:hypothetical protein